MRILIVEDNPKLAHATKVSLEQNGYCVHVAGTVEEGGALATTEHHDAIILDIRLPDGDGVTLCRELRRRGVTTPILMLTVLGSTADKVAGLDAGADDFVTRPFQTEELLARLRSLLRRSQATEGGSLRSGGLVLEIAEHRVTLDGTPIRLSAKEFALLEYMMRNPGRLLTRTMIGESVWDMNFEPNSNVIEVYVANLRRKIDRVAGVQFIETLIGSGYRFREAESPVQAISQTATHP